MKKLTDYLIARARERSTWLGLVSVATALGLVLGPAQQEAVIAAGMATAGLIGTFTRDKTP
ncbi:MAG: hypothetical protein ACAH83_18350 [Alphaproteobacteria bacterium]